MGLLDFLSTPDAQLGMGLLAAAGPRSDGAGFGQRLTEGMGYAQAQQDNALKRKMAVLAEQEGGMKLEGMKRTLADQTAQREILRNFNRTDGVVGQAAPQSSAKGLGPGLSPQVMAGLPPEFQTPAVGALPGYAPPKPPTQNASLPGKEDKFSQYTRLADQLTQGGQPEAAEKFYAIAEKFRPKYSTTPQQMMVGGKLQNVLVAEDGSMKTLDGFGVKPDMVSEDLGGSKQWVDKNSVTNGQTLAKTMTPGEVASNQLGWAGNGIARERMAFDKSQVGKPQFHDGSWVTPPNAQNPQGTALQVPGFNKPLTEAQGNAVSFSLRAQNALENLAGQKTVSNKDYYASQTPWGLGNFAMSDAGQQSMNSEKQFIAAVLRKESGAAISQGEYTSYGAQLFPRPGDSQAVLGQKAQNRELALKAMRIQAGQSGTAQGDQAYAAVRGGGADGSWDDKPKAPTPLKGMTRGGYKFKGGDASDQNNWEKM